MSDETVDYEQWGLDFFTEAINEERVLDAVRIIAGQQIEFGPVNAGPGGIATVKAYGEIRQPSATRIAGEHVEYRVLLPLELTFEVSLQVEQRFEAELLVPFTLRAVPRSGVRIFIEAEPPEDRGDAGRAARSGDALDGAAAGRRRRGRATSVRRRVRRRRAGKPHVQATRTIDVSGAMDGVWAVIGPSSEDGEPAHGGLG